jgi:hypothetical protein
VCGRKSVQAARELGPAPSLGHALGATAATPASSDASDAGIRGHALGAMAAPPASSDAPDADIHGHALGATAAPPAPSGADIRSVAGRSLQEPKTDGEIFISTARETLARTVVDAKGDLDGWLQGRCAGHGGKPEYSIGRDVIDAFAATGNFFIPFKMCCGVDHYLV